MSKRKTRWTLVALVLDESSSMLGIRKEALDAFNEQISAIKENSRKGGRTRVSLIKFSTTVNPLYEGVTASKAQPLTDKSYRPSGVTAMYDAVGTAVSILESYKGPQEGDEVAYLVVVISDGLENASQEHTANTIAEIVRSRQNTGNWTFVYRGANQDLSDIEKHIGFGSVRPFVTTPTGINTLSTTLRSGITNYYTSRGMGMTASAESFNE